MNSLLDEIYSTILPSAPFIIAAYALVWFSLLVFVFVSFFQLKKTEAKLNVLEQSVEKLNEKLPKE